MILVSTSVPEAIPSLNASRKEGVAAIRSGIGAIGIVRRSTKEADGMAFPSRTDLTLLQTPGSLMTHGCVVYFGKESDDDGKK